MTEVHSINNLKSRTSSDYGDVEISENSLSNNSFLVILRGGLKSSNPKAYMDGAVAEYVQNTIYNEFVEVFMDNPWVRVLIFNFNSIDNWKKFVEDRSLPNGR